MEIGLDRKGLEKEVEGNTRFGGKKKPDKEEWLKKAERAYEAVFGERDRITTPSGHCRRKLTFSEIEEEAVREGNRLARWMLEEKISS